MKAYLGDLGTGDTLPIGEVELASIAALDWSMILRGRYFPDSGGDSLDVYDSFQFQPDGSVVFWFCE